MKKWMLALGAPLVLAAQPLSAQEAGTEDAEAMAMLTEAFAAEPLTPEQESRLPLAETVVGKLLPPGSMKKVMDSTLGGIMGPFMDMASASGPNLAEHIGYDESELEITEEKVAEVAAIVDPKWQERQKREMTLLQSAMGEVMQAMEPAMRKGMSEAYAVAFTNRELTDLSAFFSTDTGASFASKSYELANDPRIMGAAMSAMPAMMEQFAALGERIEAAMADLPAKKTFETLSPADKARLLALTGLSEEDLKIGMDVAAETVAEDRPF